MAKRIKLSDRHLPCYSCGEEIMNVVTHIIGGALGIVALTLCVIKAVIPHNTPAIIGCSIYGVSMITLYTMSSVYHGLRPGMAKKVLQILDHCTIYFLIAGTYTAVLLTAVLPTYPKLCWGLLAFEWVFSALAATLTAIDLKKYNAFSMICYIGTGWAILPFWRQINEVLTVPGFQLLFLGGIAYTIGAVLYGIGAKKKWMHSVFHIFVVLGSLLQFLCIFCYGL